MFFENIAEGKRDPVFGLMGAFKEDMRPHKVDLVVGVFTDEELKKQYIPSVLDAQKKVAALEKEADYLFIDGIPQFIDAIGNLVFGSLYQKERIYGAQAVGGLGAIRVAADFIYRFIHKEIYLPQLTYPNHFPVFERAGFTIHTLTYYNTKTRSFDPAAYCEELKKLPLHSVVLFQAACHNPTGCDPTFDEWKEISDICKKRSLLPFFDCAYHGFGDGLAHDVQAIRYFLEQGHDMIIAYSCSKNFTLYAQRTGALFVVCNNDLTKMRVGSQIKQIIRSLYSNPPSFGAKIVQTILEDPQQTARWKKEVDQMRYRIQKGKELLYHKLFEKEKGKDFRFILQSRGIFCYFNLNEEQVNRLRETEAIYLSVGGRLNVCGLTTSNIDHVVNGILGSLSV